MEEALGGITGGNYASETTVHKILLTRLWWETLHKDCKAYCKACDHFQCVGKPRQRDEIPLIHIPSADPFEKWAIEFVGPIFLSTCITGSCYIITCTNYLTRWEEEPPTKDCTTPIIAKFLW